MGIVAKSPPVCSMSSQHQPEFHQDNLFSFINEFDRSSEPGLEAHHHEQIGPKVSSGFDPTPPTSTLDGIDQSTAGLHPVYETAGMLSEIFSRFEPEPGPSGPGEMVDYRWDVGGLAPEWYGTRQVEPMQLFLTNPPPRSPPSPPQQPPPGNSSSTLHMLLPSPSSIPTGGAGGGFHAINTLHHQQQRLPGNTNPNLWGPDITHPTELDRIVQGQGLSLSLSSSLHPNLQALMGPFGPGPSPSSTGQHQAQQFGFRSDDLSSCSLGMVNVLSNSKYSKPAQELLEEFCSVGIRGHLKNNPKLSRQNSVNLTRTTSSGGGGGGGGDVSPSTTKDPPPLSASDRIEHQRRKVKLVSMLDEVYKRYKNYYSQMQMIVNSLELMMGYGSATAYTLLALKAMSRHFRCLKDTIHGQIKQSCKLLREEDPTVMSGLTKGETPRLKLLERSLRQQMTFHQMGFSQQQGWRPQRGLPLRCVNVLRAWLFEHFLNPYPNVADKHMLARQTGLSKNQVSNWFINARVRLWKPMVEEMYKQESKELEDEGDTYFNQTSSSTSNTNNSNPNPNPNPNPSLNPNQSPNTNTFVAETMTSPPESDPSSSHPATINCGRRHHHQPLSPQHGTSNVNVGPHTMIRFGKASSDVSLTLGLRHAENAPDKSAAFSFGS